MSVFDDAFKLDGMGNMGSLLNLSPKRRKATKKKAKGKSKTRTRRQPRSSSPFDISGKGMFEVPIPRKQKSQSNDIFGIPSSRKNVQGFFNAPKSSQGLFNMGNGKKKKRASAKDAATGFEAPDFFGGLRRNGNGSRARDETFDNKMMQQQPAQQGLGIQIPELGQDFNTRFGRIGSGFVESVDPFGVGFSSKGIGGGRDSGVRGLSELEREAFRRDKGTKRGRKPKLSDRERELITIGRRTQQDESKKKKLLSELEKNEKKERKEFEKAEKKRTKEQRDVVIQQERQDRGEVLKDEVAFTQARSAESEEDFTQFEEGRNDLVDEEEEEEEENGNGFKSERVGLGEGRGFGV